jgi:amino acid transporter|tara:strand:+ start:341 stop:793 length:453 start_codon:yes stop_codon:yes gene_type:complete
MQFLKNYSNRELNIWAELVLDLIVSIYFFPKLFLLIISGDIHSNESIILITTTIFISIAYSIVVFTIINIFKESEKKDERDYIFELKSYKISNTIFQISILSLICWLFFTPLSNHYEFTPIMIASFLIIITLFCSAGKSVSLLYFYRRSI